MYQYYLNSQPNKKLIYRICIMKIINKALFTYFGNKDREIEKIMENLPDMNNNGSI